MKVLFTSRSTLFSQPGGDTQQLVQTAEALRALNIKVDILLKGEKIELEQYDLVHFFNLGRPADVVDLLPKIKQPLVISSIWVDYSEYDKYRVGLDGKVQRLIGSDRFEWVKSIARGINGTDAFPGATYLKKGHLRSLKLLADRADAVICSSASEQSRISSRFDNFNSIHVVPLGLTSAYLKDFVEQEREGVLVVGRIEGLKNQLNIIKAANASKWKLKIVGKSASNQANYFKECKKKAKDNTLFKGWVEGDKLLEEYRKAKVLVLPSYFETFGLVALEALSQGCNLVISDRADMNSIFQDKALLCNPNSPDDIKLKTEEALKLPPVRLTKNEKQQYTWESAAEKIKLVYHQLLEE